MSAGAVEGSGISETGSVSLLLPGQRLRGFSGTFTPSLSPISRSLNQLSWGSRGQILEHPKCTPSFLINWVSVRLGTSNEADCPDLPEEMPIRKCLEKPHVNKPPLPFMCWTLMVLDSEAISPALAGHLWLIIDSFQVEEGWPSTTTDSGESPRFSCPVAEERSLPSPHLPLPHGAHSLSSFLVWEAGWSSR